MSPAFSPLSAYQLESGLEIGLEIGFASLREVRRFLRCFATEPRLDGFRVGEESDDLRLRPALVLQQGSNIWQKVKVLVVLILSALSIA